MYPTKYCINAITYYATFNIECTRAFAHMYRHILTTAKILLYTAYLLCLFLCCFVAMETTGPHKRPLAISIRIAFWPVGQCLLALLAYYIQDWNWLQLTISVPAYICGAIQFLYVSRNFHHVLATSYVLKC